MYVFVSIFFWQQHVSMNSPEMREKSTLNFFFRLHFSEKTVLEIGPSLCHKGCYIPPLSPCLRSMKTPSARCQPFHQTRSDQGCLVLWEGRQNSSFGKKLKPRFFFPLWYTVNTVLNMLFFVTEKNLGLALNTSLWLCPP